MLLLLLFYEKNQIYFIIIKVKIIFFVADFNCYFYNTNDNFVVIHENNQIYFIIIKVKILFFVVDFNCYFHNNNDNGCCY